MEISPGRPVPDELQSLPLGELGDGVDSEELDRLAALIPPEIRFGTSTWTYPGWSGLVYHRAYP
jgi:hypothetical protein